MTAFGRFVASARPLALGDLGLLPHEFEALTPHEFDLVRRGRRRRGREWLLVAADLLAQCVSPWLKSPISGLQLLGWPANWRKDDDA